MFLNAFVGRSKQPTEKELAAELGASKDLWDQLLAELLTEQGLSEKEWTSYSPKAGWSLRLKAGQRNIVYLSPSHGEFMASFVLGAKAMDAVRGAAFPGPVIQLINDAKRYAEGTAVRIKVKKKTDIAIVRKLTIIKMGN